VVCPTHQLPSTWERDLVPNVQEAQEARWASGPVWMSKDNIALTRVQTPN